MVATGIAIVSLRGCVLCNPVLAPLEIGPEFSAVQCRNACVTTRSLLVLSNVQN